MKHQPARDTLRRTKVILNLFCCRCNRISLPPPPPPTCLSTPPHTPPSLLGFLYVCQRSWIINVTCFLGGSWGRRMLVVQGQRVSECSGSDTVFIALAQRLQRGVDRVSVDQRPGLLPDPLRCRRRRSSAAEETPSHVCLSLNAPRQTPGEATTPRPVYAKLQDFDPERNFPPPPPPN